jgi:hypothetical protein
MKLFLFSFSLLLAAGKMTAQTTLQVVTKTMQKSISWKAGYTLEINCEKAEVELEAAPAGQKNISVKAELSARHPLLDSARHDLAAWQFVATTVGKKIYIRAYIGLPAGKPLPASNLKAKIKVTAPANCPATLTNKFGSARLEKIAAPVHLNGEFCTFSLLELGGRVEVESHFGNIQGKLLSGPVEIQAKRADITLSGLQHDCTVRSEYGAVTLEAVAQTGNVHVQASKSDVTVETISPFLHNLDLRADHGEITLPISLRLDAGISGDVHHTYLHQGEHRPRISVETFMGDIIVR